MATMTETQRAPKPPYPPEWRGAWFRPGVPGGMPSLEAKVAAWGVLIKAEDRRVAEQAQEAKESGA